MSVLQTLRVVIGMKLLAVWEVWRRFRWTGHKDVVAVIIVMARSPVMAFWNAESLEKVLLIFKSFHSSSFFICISQLLHRAFPIGKGLFVMGDRQCSYTGSNTHTHIATGNSRGVEFSHPHTVILRSCVNNTYVTNKVRTPRIARKNDGEKDLHHPIRSCNSRSS